MKSVLLVLFSLGIAIAQSPLKDFNEGSSLFAADVYSQLSKIESGNFLVCPISVNIAMAFAQAGAKGQTATQISKGLHISEDPQKVQDVIRELSPTLQQSNEFYNLSCANKMYVKNGFRINNNFKKVAVDVFQSEIENIEFTDTARAAAAMNNWVEEQTHNKIRNLIQKEDLDENTRLVLLNAIYFHGIWVNQFDKDATRERPFFLNSRQQVNTLMMETLTDFQYHESTELQAKFLVLPYKGDFSMVIVLPNSKDGLPELEGKLPQVLSLSAQSSKFTLERVHAIIPKFKIETTIKFVPILQALGITEPFGDSADFSGISTNGEELKISKIVQKAFVEVEEEGTTAAAATAVVAVVPLSSLPFEVPKYKYFKADHPFLFMIKSKRRRTVYFIGRHSV